MNLKIMKVGCLESDESTAFALPGLRVIIVEDEAMLAVCLGDVIAEEGCIVVGTAGTLAEASVLAATANFDIAIVDLHLHGQQADEVVASIIRSGRAVLISTGSDASEVPVAFRAWPVLRKPYNDDAIFAAIKSAAATRALLDLQRKPLPA